MTNKIDYAKINIPKDKNPKEYSWQQRRAEILRLIVQAGHPSAVSRTGLGKRYGVTHGQISQDVKALSESYEPSSSNTVKFVNDVVYNKCIKKLLDQGKYRDAALVLDKWNSWLFNVGDIDKSADKVEFEGSHKISWQDFAKAYEEIKKKDESSNS